MKIPAVIPVREEILSIKKTSVQNIRKMYGELGVDIYQGKNKVSILEKKDNKKINKIINRIKQFLGFNSKSDYNNNDSMHDVVLKYMCNKKTGTYQQIEEKFGEKGIEEVNKFKLLGYAE